MSFRKKIKAAARSNPEKRFLSFKGQDYTYADALTFTDAFSQKLDKFEHIAIISDSGSLSYFSVFAAILLDATYMHLNVDWPEQRINDILAQATPDLVVCHSDWIEQHASLFSDHRYERIYVSDTNIEIFDNIAIFKKRHSTQNLLSDYKKKKGIKDLLYVMFTSGSTGRPKGVPIAASSADAYTKAMVDTFKIEHFERWLQPVDLHFDVSMMTVFPAWMTSGCILALPASQSPFGPRIIKKLGDIDNWVSVPSVIARAKSLGMLKADTMPSLRRSFFCGEALPSDLAQSWAEAAPNSEINNLYGPTEATIAATWQKFTKTDTQETIVPIGRPLPGTFVRLGEANEIELGGPQVFYGYLGQPGIDSTALTTDDEGIRWYKTGDVGRFSEAETLHFKGRIDWQVKISGYRVEIEGIEAVIRTQTQTALVAVVPLNEVAENSYEMLVAFVETGIDISQLKAALSKTLPEYMIPKRIFEIREFPQNPNGKIDRNALIALATMECKK